MELLYETLALRTRHPFVIARGGSSDHETVGVVLTDADGAEGWGEAAPNRYYGESVHSVADALDRFAPLLAEADAWSLEAIEAELNATLRFNGSAKSAVSAALHDLVGKRLGVPLYRLWGLDPARAPRSSYTIGIGDPESLALRVVEAAAYPILKVKLGTDRDGQIIRTVREAAPLAVIRVDANAAWSPKHALRMIAMLAEYGVELVEQPVAAQDLEGLKFVHQRSPLPIIADESCAVASDIPKLAGSVDGINIKLSKCGSLREALRMVAVARAHGMLVMIGCMIESSLGITTAAHLSPLVDYADLDGAALLADDPFLGATIDGGVVSLPDGPGLGVEWRPESSEPAVPVHGF